VQEGDTHDNAGRDHEEWGQNRPPEPHQRLLVADADVTERELEDEAARPTQVADDLPQIMDDPERSSV
jgi:hypothetical protein